MREHLRPKHADIVLWFKAVVLRGERTGVEFRRRSACKTQSLCQNRTAPGWMQKLDVRQRGFQSEAMDDSKLMLGTDDQGNGKLRSQLRQARTQRRH